MLYSHCLIQVKRKALSLWSCVEGNTSVETILHSVFRHHLQEKNKKNPLFRFCNGCYVLKSEFKWGSSSCQVIPAWFIYEHLMRPPYHTKRGFTTGSSKNWMVFRVSIVWEIIKLSSWNKALIEQQRFEFCLCWLEVHRRMRTRADTSLARSNLPISLGPN